MTDLHCNLSLSGTHVDQCCKSIFGTDGIFSCRRIAPHRGIEYRGGYMILGRDHD